MTDRMFTFMSNVVSISSSDGRFNLPDLPSTEEDLALLLEAKRHRWLVTKSYDSRITPAGHAAYLAEKEKRDCSAEEAAQKSKRDMKAKVLSVAVSIVAAVLAAIAGAVVAHWLQ